MEQVVELQEFYAWVGIKEQKKAGKQGNILKVVKQGRLPIAADIPYI